MSLPQSPRKPEKTIIQTMLSPLSNLLRMLTRLPLWAGFLGSSLQRDMGDHGRGGCMSREDPRIQQTPDEMQSCATLTAKTGVRGRHPWFSPHRSRTHLLKSYYEQADSCLLGLCNGKSGSQGAPSPVGERTLKKKNRSRERTK